MKVAIGSDHRGVEVRLRIQAVLRQWGHEVLDWGAYRGFGGVAASNRSKCTLSVDPVDYPDIAFAVAEAVSQGQAERGILVCGTGIGMCIAANKVQGVRAAPCHDTITAEMSRRHNDANILCLSADLLGADRIEDTVQVWLNTPFEGGRHERRIRKIAQYELRVHANPAETFSPGSGVAVLPPEAYVGGGN